MVRNGLPDGGTVVVNANLPVLTSVHIKIMDLIVVAFNRV